MNAAINPSPAGSTLEDIRVMLLPLTERDVLVPASAVSEIISADAVHPLPEMPDWLLGELLWRGYQVPALTFEPKLETTTRRLAHARVIVCFMPTGHMELPYVALYSRDMPRLERSSPERLIAEAGQHPFALSALRIGEHHAWLPDFNAIEYALLTHRRDHPYSP